MDEQASNQHPTTIDPLVDMASAIPSASPRTPVLPAHTGRLGALASWWRTTAGTPTPQHPVLVMTAADDRAGALAAGESLAARLADRSGVPIRILDVRVDAAGDEPDRSRAIERTRSAIDTGAALADELIDSGVDLLLVADAGGSSTVAAAAVIGLLVPADAVTVTDRGAGIDDDAWMRECAAIRDAMRRGRPYKADALDLLAAVGGPDVAAMVGVLMRSAQRRTPVLLDGVTAAAAALVGQRASHRARDWWLAAQRSDGAGAAALERLDLVPVLDLGMRSPEGVCALLALPILIGATLAV